MNLHISKSKNYESFYVAKSYVKANGSARCRESNRYAIAIHEQAQLNNWTWSVFFTFAVFLIAVILFNFEIIVGTIVVKYLIVSVNHKVAVLINF